MGGEFTPVLAMVAVQVGYAGMNVVSKLAMDDGMSPFVLTAYRQIVATLVLFPVAILLEREAFKLVTIKVLQRVFWCSIFGATCNQLLYFLGLKYSSPTIACALSNMLPAITFVLAVPFKMETVGIRTLAGQAKVIGTVLSVGGSMLMTFYKGSLINMWQSHIHWRYVEQAAAAAGAGNSSAAGHNMALGAAFVIASCVAWAIWFIIQAKVSKVFSSPYTSSAIMCSMAAVQCVAIAACFARSPSQWALGWDIRLAASVYAGVIGSGLAVSLMTWCIQRRGPLFVSMFSPLLLVIVAILGWAILNEKLYVGSVTGSVLIVVGLYMVLWGKGRETKQMGDAVVGPAASYKEGDEEEGAAVSGSSAFSGTPSHHSQEG